MCFWSYHTATTNTAYKLVAVKTRPVVSLDRISINARKTKTLFVFRFFFLSYLDLCVRNISLFLPETLKQYTVIKNIQLTAHATVYVPSSQTKTISVSVPCSAVRFCSCSRPKWNIHWARAHYKRKGDLTRT